MKTLSLPLFKQGTSFSFEFFPPKTPEGIETLTRTIQELEPYHPSFVSVTYGAGGSTRGMTQEVVRRIQRDSNIPTVPHLTCVGHSKEEIDDILNEHFALGVRAILALRGDPPLNSPDYKPERDAFHQAAELVAHIRQREKQFNHEERIAIGVAGFPEGHPATPNRLLELDYLKAKVDQGADYICTQLFFDNHAFFDFRERCILAGINIPIVAGIMPITSLPGMKRMAELSGGTCFPANLQKALARAQGNPKSIEEVGIQYASQQCAELLNNNVDGLHFYTLNQSHATRSIYRNLGIGQLRA